MSVNWNLVIIFDISKDACKILFQNRLNVTPSTSFEGSMSQKEDTKVVQEFFWQHQICGSRVGHDWAMDRFTVSGCTMGLPLEKNLSHHMHVYVVVLKHWAVSCSYKCKFLDPLGNFYMYPHANIRCSGVARAFPRRPFGGPNRGKNEIFKKIGRNRRMIKCSSLVHQMLHKPSQPLVNMDIHSWMTNVWYRTQIR